MPFVIGLTGGIGSGKTAASNYFAGLGICIADADQISRDCVAPGEAALTRIQEQFGKTVIQADGQLDRAALRKIVFDDDRARLWLEQLLHPLIGARIQTLINRAESEYAILVSPLLLETNQADWVQRILLIDSPEKMQIARTSRRDNSSPEQVGKIMAAQMSRSERQKRADDIVVNDASLEDLHQQLDTLHNKYKALAAG